MWKLRPPEAVRYMDRCIMGNMPPADVGPSREQKFGTSTRRKGNVLMKGDKPVETAVKKVKKKAK